MRREIGWCIVRASVVLCFSLAGASAEAQSLLTRQVLDRVEVFNSTSVLEMPFDDPDRTRDFINLGIVGTNLTACKLTALDGLYCLDGKSVRHWPDTDDPGTSINEFSCADAALNLDAKKPNPCTGMTVDLSGAILLAGRKASSHSLVKVIAKPSSGCAGWSALSGGRYCARELYSGRPLLVDIEPLDGDVGAAFRPCPGCPSQSGILGLEDRKTVVFFPDPKPTAATAPIVIASGQDWGLDGNEQLLTSALFQVPDGSSVASFVLVMTTNGRMLAKQTDSAGDAFEVFRIPDERSPSSIQCDFSTQHYGIRTSSKSGRVYVTDRNFCQVVALVPTELPFTKLKNDGVGEDLTLATADATETQPPSGPTLAPGISIDLRAECGVRCDVLQNEAGTPAASFVAVKLATGSNSQATLFQIKGIPDCRYAGRPGFPEAMEPVCAGAAGVIVDPDDVGHPAAQRLNATTLLPQEVTALFDDSGAPPAGLPPLLISPQYRAQERNGFLFDAFFVVTEPGVYFRDNFTAEYDVPILEGVTTSLGCLPDPGNLIAWDVMTTVSELYVSTDIDGDNLGEHVDTLTNVGCINPTKTLGSRLSLLPYNLEVNPDTYGPTFLSANKSVTLGNDAVFARLVQSLYDDLEFVRRELACKLVDAASGQPPISASVCSTLASKWQNGKVKLDKCINAAFQPKQSTADENCQSFASQLTNYRSSIPATTPARDIANRVGELKMRVDVVRHVFDTRLLPSMTTSGFCREQDFDGNPLTCPDPWQ